MKLEWLSASEAELVAAAPGITGGTRMRGVRIRQPFGMRANQFACMCYFAVSGILASYLASESTPLSVPLILLEVMVLVGWFYVLARDYLRFNRNARAEGRTRNFRLLLTGSSNGFRMRFARIPWFASLITRKSHYTYFNPRFEGEGIEFGNMAYRRDRPGSWHYIVAYLPEPVPHLLFESMAAGGLERRFLADADSDQILSLEGDFDRSFRLYAPPEYGRDALYLITTDVMAALIDHAQQFNVELVDDYLVFFRAGDADFTEAKTWTTVDAILKNVVPRLKANVRRYRDERILVGDAASWETSYAQVDQVGASGRRLRTRDLRGSTNAVLDRFWGTLRRSLIAYPVLTGFVSWGFFLSHLLDR